MTEPSGVPDGAARDDEPDTAELWKWLARAGRPWAGWALVALGILFLIAGWIGISGESLVAKQLPYLASGCIGGIALVVVGAYFLGTEELRKDSGRLDRLEQMVTELYTALLERDDAPSGDDRRRAAEQLPATAGAPRNGRGRGEGARPPADVVTVVSGTKTFHRDDCDLVAGKEVATMDAADATQRKLRPCPVCQPAAGTVAAV